MEDHLERLLDTLREEAEKATVTLATSAAVDVAYCCHKLATAVAVQTNTADS